MGIEHVDVNIKRHGTNPIHEMKLIEYYKQLIKKVNPNVVLTYTIKPNIYGGIASKKQKIPYIANITGLGLSSEKKGLFSSMINNLYNIAFSNAKIVFFQNKANIQHFLFIFIFIPSFTDTIATYNALNCQKEAFYVHGETHLFNVFAVKFCFNWNW